MTDKQIIIDGVDVHWCEHYTGNIGYLTDKNWTCRAKIKGTKCEDWSNCYFKRWQRKEQECDMWKNLTVDNGAVALKYQQQIDQLNEQLEAYKMEAEEGKEINAELKAELEQEKAWHKTSDEISKANSEYTEKLKAENDELKKKCNIYTCGICGNKEDCNKLYKILTEIKEIAEHCIKQDICTTCDNSDKCHIEDEEIPTYDVCKLILQKISECEGNDEN